MSSLNSRRGWRFSVSNRQSSNLHSDGNLGILLTSTVPTSPLIPSSSPKTILAPRNADDSYNNFRGDGGPFTLHGENVHSDTSSVMIPVRELHFQSIFFLSDAKVLKLDAIHLEKNLRADGLVHVESHKLRDRAMNVVLSGSDAEMNKQ